MLVVSWTSAVRRAWSEIGFIFVLDEHLEFFLEQLEFFLENPGILFGKLNQFKFVQLM